MRGRCNNKSQHSYYLYGGRGIQVCDRWRSFDNFFADMGESYVEGLQLDRIDTDKNYTLENCRWATARENQNNKRNNRHFTINGVSKTLSQWIDEAVVKSSTVRQRFYVMGWSVEDALFVPKGSRRIAS